MFKAMRGLSRLGDVVAQKGAGMVILRMLERDDMRDGNIVVTHWFDRIYLGTDLMRCVGARHATHLDTL